MRRILKNKQKMKNTMFIVFGVYSLVLFGITNLNPLYAQENGIVLDSLLETSVGLEAEDSVESTSLWGDVLGEESQPLDLGEDVVDVVGEPELYL